MLWFLPVDGAGHAGLDVTKRAGAGAGVAQNHDRRMLLGPALANVGARRLFADGREVFGPHQPPCFSKACAGRGLRSEEHTSELQSLMRISYAVFCLKKKKRPI